MEVQRKEECLFFVVCIGVHSTLSSWGVLGHLTRLLPRQSGLDFNIIKCVLRPRHKAKITDLHALTNTQIKSADFLISQHVFEPTLNLFLDRYCFTYFVTDTHLLYAIFRPTLIIHVTCICYFQTNIDRLWTRQSDLREVGNIDDFTDQ